jgi:hypothetical protein
VLHLAACAHARHPVQTVTVVVGVLSGLICRYTDRDCRHK